MGDNREIEEQTITIPPLPNSENMDAQSSVGARGHSPSAGCDQPPEEHPDRKGGWSSEDGFVFVVALVIFIICFPIFLLYVLRAYLAGEIDVTEESEPKEGRKKGIYQKVQEYQETAALVAERVGEIFGRVSACFFIWFVVNCNVPSLRRKTVFGSELWKWSLFALIVTCGYSVISGIIHNFFKIITLTHSDKNDFIYYLRGLGRSIIFIIYSVSVLSTWLFYFRSRHGLRGTKTHISNDVFDFMTWTLVSLLISALLWLLKTVLLLKWKADAVYKRFKDRILTAGSQLYFVALISGKRWNIFRPDENRDVDDEVEIAGDAKEEEEKEKAKDKLNIDRDVTTYGIKKRAGYFVTLAKVSSREDDGISDLLKTCRKAVPHAGGRDVPLLEHEIDKNQPITEDNLHDAFPSADDGVKLLLTVLKERHASEEVSYATFEQWMVRAHKNCLALGYTLIDAEKMVDCLNKLMIGFLITVVILSWLLLTKNATIKLLVIIASPILMTTYIFGDSCKTLFDGIIFAFVKHPFDIGDLCIIDNIEMEVKRMGILTTSFLKMGTKDQALYPNSVLATKTIVNLKGDQNPADFVELSFDPTTKTSNITLLEDKINNYINSNDHNGKFENSNHLVIKEIGTSIRIAIHFKHMMSTLDMIHSQFVDKKNRQRSEFLFKVQQFLEELEIKTSTAS